MIIINSKNHHHIFRTPTDEEIKEEKIATEYLDNIINDLKHF